MVAQMLATRKLNSSRSFSKQLRNPNARCAGVPAEQFPNAIDKSSGDGHVSSNGREEPHEAGFLLLDASLRPIYTSEEALAILAYPGVPLKNKGLDNCLQNKIRLLTSSSANALSPAEFQNAVASGRRCYQLRAFSLKSNLGIGRGPAIALLLERNRKDVFNLESIARKFRLTQREMEAVDLLLRDLSTKQIASRMDISPNTVKAFLRSVMIKVGAENRTGIIGRILQASKAVNGETCF